MKRLLRKVTLINEGCSYTASLLTEGAYITAIFKGESTFPRLLLEEVDEVVPAEGLWLLPGCIDDHPQVNDRERKSFSHSWGYDLIYGNAQYQAYDHHLRRMAVEDGASRCDLLGKLFLLLRRNK